MFQVHKPIGVQTFITQSTIEAFGISILHRFPRGDEIQLFFASRNSPLLQNIFPSTGGEN
jgi:hypothetical protein